MPRVTLVEGINLALARALADDPDVVLVGEDIGERQVAVLKKLMPQNPMPNRSLVTTAHF